MGQRVADRPMSLWEGKPLHSGYRLIECRGQGGFGQVWEAETTTGERVAVKFLHCGDHFTAAEEVRNILRVRQLAHPNLVRIDKVWADRGYLAVAMELAEGSLADGLLLSQREFAGALPMELVCDYLKQAAGILDFLNAHKHPVGGRFCGIQHGDVKPGNMLLFENTLKLCDFGLSRVLTTDVASHRRAGTLAYAAPEVFRGQITSWSDQYSLAVSYFELRTGKFPFPQHPSRFAKTYARPEPDLSPLMPEEQRILARGLAMKPQERWPSCSALMTALSSACRGGTAGTAFHSSCLNTH